MNNDYQCCLKYRNCRGCSGKADCLHPCLQGKCWQFWQEGRWNWFPWENLNKEVCNFPSHTWATVQCRFPQEGKTVLNPVLLWDCEWPLDLPCSCFETFCTVTMFVGRAFWLGVVFVPTLCEPLGAGNPEDRWYSQIWLDLPRRTLLSRDGPWRRGSLPSAPEQKGKLTLRRQFL